MRLRLPWQRAAKRTVEATDQQLLATGALGYGSYSVDPIDGDRGFVPMGKGLRQVPPWTLEKARAFSVAAYRSNPMARAIIDTYTSFAVGDSGLTLQCTNDDVRVIAEEFWRDPANCLDEQDIFLRGHLLNGESVVELMQGTATGVVRRSVVDPAQVTDVVLYRGNPLWPDKLIIRNMGDEIPPLQVIRIDDFTGLRTGEAMFWRSFRALETDRRGDPFLSPVLDWLDSYDTVMSNLIDRTALARYIALHFKFNGTGPDGQPWSQSAIDDWIKARGGTHVPRSGTIEATNSTVDINPINAQSGSFEDTQTAGATLTSIAAGSGLSKHWLAEPDQANRATSQSMAEPVRRRVGGVQNLWLKYQTDLVRFAVDQAVAAGRVESMVTVPVSGPGDPLMMPAASTVSITGPAVAASDEFVVSQVMWNVAQSLEKFVADKIMSPEAAQVAAEKTWEQLTGLPFPAELSIDNTEQTGNELNDAGGVTVPSLIGQLIAS